MRTLRAPRRIAAWQGHGMAGGGEASRGFGPGSAAQEKRSGIPVAHEGCGCPGRRSRRLRMRIVRGTTDKPTARSGPGQGSARGPAKRVGSATVRRSSLLQAFAVGLDGAGGDVELRRHLFVASCPPPAGPAPRAPAARACRGHGRGACGRGHRSRRNACAAFWRNACSRGPRSGSRGAACRGGVLGDVAVGAGADHLHDVLHLGVHAEHQHADLRQLAAQGLGGGQAAQAEAGSRP